jgi:hypothetical protein
MYDWARMEGNMNRTILVYRRSTMHQAVGLSAREISRLLRVKLQRVNLNGTDVDAVCFNYAGSWQTLLEAIAKHTPYNVGIVQ